MMNMHPRRWVAAVLGGLLLLTGCSDDDNPAGPAAPAFPVADSPQQWLDNFQNAYHVMDLEEYTQLLDADFVFLFAPEDLAISPRGVGFLDVATELAAAVSMFTGKSGHRVDGSEQPPVQAMKLTLTAVTDDWVTAEDPELTGLLQREYGVQLVVIYSDGSVSRVAGIQRFFLSTRSEGSGDSAVPVYYLARWEDLGDPLVPITVAPPRNADESLAAGVETMSWGAVKARFIPQPDPLEYPFATTPDLCVANFVRAYHELNFLEYDKLLHDLFVFYFSPEDVDRIPGGRGFWDRQADISSTGRMFSGQPGLKPDGVTVQAAVQDIDLRLEAVGGQWVEPDDPEFAGTMQRNYNTIMTVTYTNGDISQVQGEQQFFVTAIEVPVGPVTLSVYQLKFWRDTGNPLVGFQHRAAGGVDETSWGAFKAMF